MVPAFEQRICEASRVMTMMMVVAAVVVAAVVTVPVAAQGIAGAFLQKDRLKGHKIHHLPKPA